MDDEPDRAYSRAPELQDLVDLCRALGEEGVRYLLIGRLRLSPRYAGAGSAAGVREHSVT